MNPYKLSTKLFQDGCNALLKASNLEGVDSELLMVILSSFITCQNIVVTADNSGEVAFVQQWLELIAANIIGAEDVVTVTFHTDTTWDEVEEALMSATPSSYYCEMPKKISKPASDQASSRYKRGSQTSTVFTNDGEPRYISRYGSISSESGRDFPSIRNSSIESDKKYRSALPRFIILKDLDRASREIQSLFVQGLIRKKVVCNGIEYPFPHFSVMVALINLKRGKGVEGLMPHLKDLFFFSHHVNLEESLNCTLTKDELKRKVKELPNIQPKQVVTAEMIQEAVERIDHVVIIPELRVYMQDIVIFLRTHRLVQAGRGVSPKVVKDFERLLRILCVVENSDYATPSLVAKAARKVFPLKVEMCRTAKDEPTLSYGSDIKLVTKWIQKWDVDLIIEDVLNIVPAPM